MVSTEPKHNYDQYNEELSGSQPLTEFRLHIMARQLNFDKKKTSGDYILYNTLGIIYQRLGKHTDALGAFKTSFILGENSVVAENIIACLTELKKYDQVMDFAVKNRDFLRPFSLMLATLVSGRYHEIERDQLGDSDVHVLKTLESLNVTRAFSDLYCYLLDSTPLGTQYNLETDMDDDGMPVVRVDFYINATVEEAVAASWKLSMGLVNRFAPDVLMHIILSIQVKE